MACVYLPPSILHEDVDYFYDYFQSCYDILTAESCDTAFIIAGDFNPTCNCFKPRNLNVHCSFKQVINEATRNTSILDLIFTNVDQFYEAPQIIARLSSADHNMVIWTSKIKKVTVRAIKPFALESFHGFLASYNWTDVTCASSADDKLEKFRTATNTMINEINFFLQKLFDFTAMTNFL